MKQILRFLAASAMALATLASVAAPTLAAQPELNTAKPAVTIQARANWMKWWRSTQQHGVKVITHKTYTKVTYTKVTYSKVWLKWWRAHKQYSKLVVKKTYTKVTYTKVTYTKVWINWWKDCRGKYHHFPVRHI